MDLKEYESVKNYSYDEYCNYLENKYGKCTENYFSESFSRNPKVSRTKEGLFAHHRMENKACALSDPETAKYFPYEYQEAKNIIYCDYLEHLLLHILISCIPDIDPDLGIGGVDRLISRLDSIYYSDDDYPDWEEECINNIIDDEDVYERLLERANGRSVLLEHNIAVYKALDEYLRHSNKALVIIGTGGGKTTTALEYLRVNKIRGLVLCPSNIIKDAWADNDSVDSETYNYFRENYKNIDYSKYGAIIIDEAHHCSDDNILGNAIRWAMENVKNIKFIGLTAEEKRTDGTVVADILFDGNVAEGITIEDGIEKKIFYPFTYIGAFFDTSDLRQKYSNDPLIRELDLVLNNTPTLKEIITRNMPDNKRKGIIFASNIEAIDEAIKIMTDIYPDAEYRIIHSKMKKNEVEENKEWFKNTDEGYLVAVNMISEGAHYPGVNTLIMFRKTESPLIFNQQLGRIITLTKFNDPKAVVFDLVNNAFNTYYGRIRINKKSSDTNKIRKLLKSSQIIVKDYSIDIRDVLNKIKENNDLHWSEDEDEILRKYYPIGGAKECKKYLIDRNDGSIKARAQKLGIKWDNPNLWSSDEDDIIKKYYPTGGKKECKKYLPNRTEQVITRRAQTLGIKLDNRLWTSEEDDILRKYYPIGGKKECKKYLPNKTEIAIPTRAKKLGIKSDNRYWSLKEDDILRTYYPIGGKKECKKYLPNKNENSIIQRASKLGIKWDNPNLWSSDEDDIIKKYYPIGGKKECKKYLPNRTEGAILSRANEIGINYDDFHWSPEEDEFIKKYYPTGGAKECKKYLSNRTEKIIVGRAQLLGIKWDSNWWSPDEDEILRKYYPTGGKKECKKYLPNRTEQVIMARASKLGIKKERSINE